MTVGGRAGRDSSPSALLMPDDWNAMGLPRPRRWIWGAKTQTGPVYPVKPAGVCDHGHADHLNPGG